ncbi:MAG: methyltransferase domain-containing protein [Candidatus Binatia bacterium]
MADSKLVGVIGDLSASRPTHVATNQAIGHAAAILAVRADITWIPTPELVDAPAETLARFDGIFVAPGSPYASMEGALRGIQYARQNRVPLLGTCGGFQHVALELGRNVLGRKHLQHAEYDPDAPELLIERLERSLSGKRARAKLAQTGSSVELRTADAEDSLPWDADFFDAITLTGVLHHFFRPKDALSEAHRVLRPGGRLLLIDPCFFRPVRQILNLALRIAPHDGDFHFYSPGEATGLLAALGFEVRRTHRVGLWAFLADALKAGLPKTSEDTGRKSAPPTGRSTVTCLLGRPGR